MEGTRSRIFISKVGESVQVLLLISLFIWTTKGAETTIPLLGAYFVFSPTVVYATLIYLLIAVVIPYLIGHYRAKRWIENMEQQRENTIDQITKFIVHPNIGKVIKGLEDIEQGIMDQCQTLDETKYMKLADEIEGTQDDKKLIYQLALHDSRKRDPRNIHRDKLTEILQLIRDCKLDMEGNAQGKEKREALKGYLDLLKLQKKKQKVADPSSNPWIMTGITSIVGSLLTPILSFITKLFATKLGIPQ